MARERYGKKADEQRLKKQIRNFITGLVLVFVLVSALIIYIYNKNNYVAKVGSEKITKAEYMMIFSQEKRYMMEIFGISEQEAESFWNTKIEGEYAIDRAKKGALDMAWESKIQYIKAKEKGITLTKDEKEGISILIEDSIPDNYRSLNEKNEFFNSLFGITYREFKKIYTDLFLIKKYVDIVYDEMEVSYEEAEQFYQDNRDDFDMATVRHILIAVDEEASDEEKQAAREKAEEILGKAESGEDFDSLALEYPDDAQSSYEYSFTRNTDYYAEEIKEWAFEHAEGDVGMVETSDGFYVLELVEKLAGFDQVTEHVRTSIKNKKFAEMLEEWKELPQFRLVKNDRVYDSIS